MSQQTEVPGGKPNENASGNVEEENNQDILNGDAGGETKPKTDDSVSYGSFKKVLDEKKRTAAEKAELESELQKLREQQLTDAGKKDELIEELKKRLDKTESTFKQQVGTFAMREISNAVKTEALKQGCSKPEVLSRIADLSEVEIDDEFNVDADQVKALIEKTKQDVPELFQAKSANVNTVNPGGKPRTQKGVDLKKMSTEQIIAYAKEKYNS